MFSRLKRRDSSDQSNDIVVLVAANRLDQCDFTQFTIDVFGAQQQLDSSLVVVLVSGIDVELLCCPAVFCAESASIFRRSSGSISIWSARCDSNDSLVFQFDGSSPEGIKSERRKVWLLTW